MHRPFDTKKGPFRGPLRCLAGGEGFEPPLAESESAVLPLDDPPIRILLLAVYSTGISRNSGGCGMM